MRKHLGVIFFICISFIGNTQNLVQNFSFEEFDECPDEVTVYSQKELIPHWLIPTRGTTDYFNACTIHQVNVPDNILGSMYALDGNAYAGIVLIERPPSFVKMKKTLDYREYLQTKLSQELKTGKLYAFKFYFSIASYSTYAVNRIGMHVSRSKISNRVSSKVLDVKPQIEMDTIANYYDRDYWYQVCDTFRAEGGERYITIGNFYDDYETGVVQLDYSKYRGSIQQTIKENKIAYYYIDVVSVQEVADTTQNYCLDKYLTKNRLK